MTDSGTASTDADDLDTIARAIGLVVLQWGQAEQSLDLLVAVLWQSFDGKRFAKRIPVMLEPKIHFVRACLPRQPDLTLHAEAAERLLLEFERLSGLRHDLIHGAVASLAPVNRAFVFARLEVRDGFHHHKEVHVSVDAYPQIIDQLVALGAAAHQLVAEVFEVAKDLGPIVK